MNQSDASRGNDVSNPLSGEHVKASNFSNQSQEYPWTNSYNPIGQQQTLHTHTAQGFQQHTLQNTYQFGTLYQMYPQQMTFPSLSGLPQNPTFIQQPGVIPNVHLPTPIDLAGKNVQGYNNSFQPVYQPRHDGSEQLETVAGNVALTEQTENSTTPNVSSNPNPNKKKRKKRNKGNKAAQKKRAKARKRQQEQEMNMTSDDMEISDIEDELDTSDAVDKPKHEAIVPPLEPTLPAVNSVSGDPQEVVIPEIAPSVTVDNASNENDILQKRDRLQLALNKIKLENAKAKLLAAQRQKEGALRSKLMKKLSSINETSLAAESTDSQDQNETDVINEGDHAKHLPDVSGLRMPNLIISNIGEAGPEENIRPRGVDSLAVPVVNDDSRSKQNEKELPISKADKLRLNLELAKRRLKLEELRHQKIKRSTTLKENDEVSNCVENGENNAMVEAKLSVAEMRRKHAELTVKVNSSRQANLQRIAEKEVSDLRKLVDKQQQMLRYHVEQIKASTTALSEDRQQIVNENAGIEESKKTLASLQLRRVSTLETIQSVTKKLMKLRRQRELLKVSR